MNKHFLGFLYIFFVVMLLTTSGCPSNGNGGVIQHLELYIHPNGNYSNGGTQSSPLATIEEAVNRRERPEVLDATFYVAEGTYNIITRDCQFNDMDIYGGYSTDFSVRDSSMYTTTITDNRTEDGEWVTTVFLSDGTMDGFTIQGADATENSRAVALSHNAIFTNNKVIAGTGVDVDGIAMDGDNITVRDNTITGGTGSDGAGGIFVGGCHPGTVIEDNTIYAGTGENSTCGIAVQHSGEFVIRNNFISGGEIAGTNANSQTRGIAIGDSSSVVVENNTVYGGKNGDYATGIDISNQSNATVRNNTVFGGEGVLDSKGVAIASSSPEVDNNTISGGISSDVSGIRLSQYARPYIRNNIIFVSGETSGYCVHCDASDSYPSELYHNDLWDSNESTKYLYDQGDFTALSSVNDQGYAFGNVDFDPDFRDIGGGDGLVETMEDNDWQLSSTTPGEVKGGGYDLSDQFDYDKNDDPRTDPFSIGAYERD
jgi:parallel beta-helix repeat protein